MTNRNRAAFRHGPALALPLLMFAAIAVASAANSGGGSSRLWVDNLGRYATDARFVDFDGTTVRIEKTSGKVVSVPLTRLSEIDRRFARQSEFSSKGRAYIIEFDRQRQEVIRRLMASIETLKGRQMDVTRKGSRRRNSSRGRSRTTQTGTARRAGDRRLDRNDYNVLQEAIKKTQVKLNRLKADSPPFAMKIALDEMSIGQIGMMWWPAGVQLRRWTDRQTFEVMQVVGEMDFLVQIMGRPVWVTGVSTAGVVDDARIKLGGNFIVTGTKTYETPIGGTKTVFVVQPFRLDGDDIPREE